MTPREHARWARALIKECGGIDEASDNCSVGRSSLSNYQNAREAAEAYDAAARVRHGEFARLNFPKPGERGTPPDPSLINRDAG